MRKEASLDMWKTLYNLTDELKALEPWKDLSDLDFIGIQENGREEPVFVSMTIWLLARRSSWIPFNRLSNSDN